MSKNGSPGIWIIFSVFVVVASLALFACQSDSGKSFQLKGKETRPVLDPAMFTGQVRAAYAAAKKYPDILNEVFCYCYCDQSPFHHHTLLSCFTDKHGAG
jgi:hypothetical protein